MLMLTPQCLTTASQRCSHDCRLFLFLPWMESIRCVNKFQKHNELLGCGSILLKMVDWRGCQASPEKTKSKKKALSTVKFDFYLTFVQKTACLFFSSKANNSFNQPFCSLVNNSRYRPPTHPKHQNRPVVMHVQLFIGKILKQKQTYTQKYKKKAFVCFWVTGVWPHWTLVFTCREKVSCRSVSVSPAEDSRISLERRIRLEPWGGDRRRRECHDSRDRKRGGKMERLLLARPSRLQRNQNNELSSTACCKRSVGAKEVGERGRWRGGNWLIGGSRGGRLKWHWQLHGRRIKTAYYVPETENVLVYLDRKQEGQNKPRRRNWERSHSIKEEFAQHQLYSVVNDLLVFFN